MNLFKTGVEKPLWNHQWIGIVLISIKWTYYNYIKFMETKGLNCSFYQYKFKQWCPPPKWHEYIVIEINKWNNKEINTYDEQKLCFQFN